ncbi:hypothetical protein QBC37DRAFT_435152 [Rhypophila decipiens]|uniref:Uncharacterized protein n=1 Tax=Rhypophila decipiens TaxID=261697 RepID=A0AAN6XT87_9PEZI|nr:hypothetical protein QBC37DRAFT_435152 [Rhypophila decipiens]
MKRPSTRLSRCIKSITIVNIVFLLAMFLSIFPAYGAATTTTTSGATRTARPTATSKGYYILPFFLPDSEPLSLVASVIHKTTIITTTIIRPTTTITSLSVKALTTSRPNANSNGNSPEDEEDITLKINCPSALTPENEACRSARIYPAIVTGRRILGSIDELAHTHVWKGETTCLVGDDTTTTWTCWQGMSLRTAVPTITPTPILPTEILDPEITPFPSPAAPLGGNDVGSVVPYAQCVSTIVENQGSQIRFLTRRYDECYFYRHMVPVIVEVGDGILNETGEEEAEKMNAGWDSKLARLGCDVENASRTLWAGTVTEVAGVATGTGEPAGDVKSSGGAGRFHGVSFMMSNGSMGTLWALVATLAGSWIHVGLCACAL